MAFEKSNVVYELSKLAYEFSKPANLIQTFPSSMKFQAIAINLSYFAKLVFRYL
jgi:hypothetical protein